MTPKDNRKLPHPLLYDQVCRYDEKLTGEYFSVYVWSNDKGCMELRVVHALGSDIPYSAAIGDSLALVNYRMVEGDKKLAEATQALAKLSLEHEDKISRLRMVTNAFTVSLVFVLIELIVRIAS